MAEVWARFNTESNAIDSLEKALYFLGQIKESPENWKWVVTCCHSALYGFAVHVAKGTDDSSVVEVTKKGHPRLITFDNALKACKKSAGAREALVTSEDEDNSIIVIQKEFRNNFEHFNPCSWSIEVSGFPNHIKNLVNVTKYLAIDINFYSHIHGDERKKLLSVFEECISKISELSEYYV